MPRETTRRAGGFPRRGVIRWGYSGDMSRPAKLAPAAVDAFRAAHPGWELEGEALARTFSFPDFGAALAFVVRVGCLAERRDHHPDVALSWGKARLTWTTHDAGGITALDLDLAEASERASQG